MKNKHVYRKASPIKSLPVNLMVIFFIASIILIAAFLFEVSVVLIAKDKEIDYSGYIDALKEQPGTNFSEVKYKEYLGDRAQVILLGEDGKIVFNSFKDGDVDKKLDKNKGKSISSDLKGDVYEHWNDPLLPEEGTKREFDFQWIDNDNLLIKTWLNKNGNIKDRASFVVDDNRNVVFVSQNEEGLSSAYGYLKQGSKLDEEQYNFLGHLANNNSIILKENFNNVGGGKYTALFFEKNYDLINDTFIKYTLFGMIGIYLLIVFLMIVVIYAIVKKPLKILDKAMDKVEKGDFTTRAYYKGTYEFENIINHFNGMVKQLWILQRKTRRLENEKKELLAHISHDLKTPLTTIEGYVNAVCDGLIPTEELPKVGEIIKERVNYTSDLINAFHEYAKLEHPDMVYQFEILNCCYIIKQYFADRYDELIDNGYDIEMDIPEEPIYMRIDLKKFQRVIGNLIDNSVKYNPEGTKIYCKVYQEGRNVHILIGDDGIGIDADVTATMFNPFVTSDKARNSSSGLGLAFVRKIVDIHGGSIKVNESSKLGITTEFELVFLAVVVSDSCTNGQNRV